MCTLFHFTDIFKAGIWADFDSVQDPELQRLAASLPSLAMQSRRDKTVRNYQYGYLRWKKWASSFKEINILPAKPHYLALYLMSLFEKAKTHAPVTLAFYSISWVHRMAGFTDPTLTDLPKIVKEAASRVLGHGQNKKAAITSTIIKKVVNKFVNLNSNLSDLRIATLCILAFSGFLRYDELCHIKFSDIVFCNDHLKIFIESSKTDIYRDGHWVFIAALRSPYCPVSILRKYLSKVGSAIKSNEYIFRAITRNKDVAKRALKKSNVPLSYTTTRSILLSAFKAVGEDPSSLGTHSLRAGGASAAASTGVEDHLFKKHGRWLSERSKDRYVTEDLRQKLFVSKNLGL